MLNLTASLWFLRQTRASFQKPQHQRLIELLQSARNDARLSARALSLKMGKQPTFIARVERGERLLEVVEFIEICAALDTDPVAVLALVVGHSTDLN